MSRVYFHSKNECLEISGSERAYLYKIACDSAIGHLLAADKSSSEELKPYLRMGLPSNHYLQEDNDLRLYPYEEQLKTFFRSAMTNISLFKSIDVFELIMNTVLCSGGNAMKLAARIYSQCEIHGWISQENLRWVADIIQQAVDYGIYRQSWDEVAEYLRTVNSEVVMSFSVTDPFPNPVFTKLSPSRFYRLGKAKQWDLAFEGLKSSGNGLEITPKTWDEILFGYEWNIFKFNHLLLWGKEVGEENGFDVMTKIIEYHNSLPNNSKETWRSTHRFASELLAKNNKHADKSNAS